MKREMTEDVSMEEAFAEFEDNPKVKAADTQVTQSAETLDPKSKSFPHMAIPHEPIIFEMTHEEISKEMLEKRPFISIRNQGSDIGVMKILFRQGYIESFFDIEEMMDLDSFCEKFFSGIPPKGVIQQLENGTVLKLSVPSYKYGRNQSEMKAIMGSQELLKQFQHHPDLICVNKTTEQLSN